MRVQTEVTHYRLNAVGACGSDESHRVLVDAISI